MVMERRLFIFCFLAVVVWQSVALAAGTPSFTALTSSLDEAMSVFMSTVQPDEENEAAADFIELLKKYFS